MRKAIICDIDQCLLDSLQPIMIQERGLALGLADDEYWNLFYDNLHLCKKNAWCYELLNRFAKDDITVLFITGRQEKARKQTLSYLDFKFKYKLYMRPNGNIESDAKVKSYILKDLVNDYNILFALDDKEANCQMYRSFGITTLKVDSMELH